MSDEIDVATVTTSLYNLLKPLEAADRKKVVKAALTLLGDPADIAEKPEKYERSGGADEVDASFHPKVQSWIQKNGVTSEQLTHVFHMDGDTAEIIAGEVPGKNGKEKTINAFVLKGVSQFLLTGDPKFDDKAAREVCRSFGCYNEANHAAYMKDKGNVLSGSKNAGWTLTSPGLKVGADLIKEIAGQ